MTQPKLLPGHISQPHLQALLEPVQHFQLLVSDMLTLRFGRGLVSREANGVELRAFCLCNSMGAGGGLWYGNSEMQVCVARLKRARLPHTRVLRRTLLNRLRTLFTMERLQALGSPLFRKKFIALSAANFPAREVLNDEFCSYLAVHASDCSLECDGENVVMLRRGTSSSAELEELMDSMEIVLRHLSGSPKA